MSLRWFSGFFYEKFHWSPPYSFPKIPVMQPVKCFQTTALTSHTFMFMLQIVAHIRHDYIRPWYLFWDSHSTTARLKMQCWAVFQLQFLVVLCAVTAAAKLLCATKWWRGVHWRRFGFDTILSNPISALHIVYESFQIPYWILSGSDFNTCK